MVQSKGKQLTPPPPPPPSVIFKILGHDLSLIHQLQMILLVYILLA